MFLEVVWEIRNRKPEVDWELFVATAWGLWNQRNTVKFGGQRKSALRLCRDMEEYVKEFRHENPPPCKSSRPSTPPWKPPKQGWYKANVDGAVCKERGCCGIGVVIRNAEGQLMGALSKWLALPLKALETEAMAMQVGIHFAWDLGLKDVVFESDSLTVISALSSDTPPPWSIQKVIEGIKQDLKCFNTWSAVHVRRSGNMAAHLMAKNAITVVDSLVWVEDIPPVIAMQVSKDVSSMNAVSF